MALRASAPTVAAVVAAHDEADRIGHVLATLTTYPGFDEVVVVDDGSSDTTGSVAERYGATCLRLPANRGKGAALDAGIRHASTDVLFLADADIRDLDHRMIDAMLEPVVAGEVDMFVAMRHRSIYHLRSILRFLPLLGGERAITAKLWHSVPERYRHRFKVEAALNFCAVHHGRGLRYRVFPIRQTPKELKYGVVPGFVRRLRMGANVAAAIAEVHANEAPDDVRSRRRAACTALAGVGALAAFLSRARSRTPNAGVPEAPVRRPRGATTHPRGGALASIGAFVAGAVVLTQVVRLAQSHARADG